jgi:hypothetical protein
MTRTDRRLVAFLITLAACALAMWLVWPILVFQVRCVLERTCP